jgi:AcrR family transcriptional regulator
MPRWSPDARQRLVVAALDLFGEQGYDETTVAQIAERAGLTRSTFFRHFPDKRDVLAAGQETLSQLLAEGIAAAPESAGPLAAVASGLDAVGSAMTEVNRELAPRIHAAIAASAELQARDMLKQVGLAAAVTEALHARGVPEPTAGLAAELGMLAFRTAFARWTEPANTTDLATLSRTALRELQEASARLG